MTKSGKSKSFIKEHRVPFSGKFKLSSCNTAEKGGIDSKEEAMELLQADQQRLKELQNLLYAESKHAVLIVLQAMDTGGKDGTIRRVLGPLNPQGVRVHSFKAPNDKEMSHDYLWRIHPCTPKKGMIVVFNRSHYEDVLITRVRKMFPNKVIENRYEEINNFEKLLADNGTVILKFFLNISKDEQKARLQERLENPDKHWKFSSADLKERKLWDDYQDAYEKALQKCSKPWAPWFVIPANRKWYRNIAISGIIRETLEGLKMKYPAAEEGLDKLVIED